ncbi:MAG: hypothetical protein JWO95_3419 [Verrucomicrobiales bacterium]|nr:hypothetical protein [Verrucomicrobiales bacterium]
MDDPYKIAAHCIETVRSFRNNDWAVGFYQSAFAELESYVRRGDRDGATKYLDRIRPALGIHQ